MGLLNNQPNSSPVFEVGRFFHEEQTKYRLQGGEQSLRGAELALILFLPLLIGTRHRPGTGAARPVLSGSRLVFLFKQAHLHISHFSLGLMAIVFFGLQCSHSVSPQATV